ncbi:DUF805 domain-containing protein [Couchioplanes caeruleus]|uniref:DUF805 domain-containing protein n=2 Tax=Couchioplanes caeruleus TaxID=56438 RepID=A0A1K0FFT9_9ACTN|nr:DUF805 domain-containing protein [Couchioplanes caeruleus]OJF11705.1 hypothetical protein BG844_24735 [Couchioplanes caeruleus subsp. caeruleus]ROP29921.1 uncharacterized membrane protein YhaH (DUF805 family) [Couchioplanes caeruleus]
MKWYLSALRNYANVNGRAGRAEYWWFRLVDALISAALLGLAIVVSRLAHDGAPAIGVALTAVFFLYALVMVLPNWAASVRRLHDTDRSGATLLFGLIPLVGGIVLLVLLSSSGTRGPNRYGPDSTMPPDAYQPGSATLPPGAVPAAATFGSGPPGPAHPAQPYPYPQAQPFIQSKPKFLARLILVPVLLLAACMFGGPAVIDLARGPSDDGQPTTSGNASTPRVEASAVARDGAAKVHGVATAGSRRSAYPVRQIADLTRVCDGWYYPKAPRYTGLAPHPIVTASRNRLLNDAWEVSENFEAPDVAWPPAKDAWRPSDPTKVRVVACADRVATRSKVRTCHVDSKPPADVTMKQAVFRVTLYEVATRNKLMQTRMTGDNEDCGPIFILVDQHDQTYTSISDRQMWETLRRYVEH